MKNRVIKLAVILFACIFGLFLISSNRASAGSIKFYFPDGILGKSYTEEGNVSLKDIDVYAYQDGTGYSFSDGDFEITGITIKTGSVTYTDTAIISMTKGGTIPASDYGNANASADAKFNIKLSSVGSLSTDSSNTLSISLEVKQYSNCFFSVCISKNDYNNVAFYKGSTYVSDGKDASISYSKTDSTFANSQLYLSTANVDKVGGGCSVPSAYASTYRACYNIQDKNNANIHVKLTMTTNFKFNGVISAYYSDANYYSVSFSNQSSSSVYVDNKSAAAEQRAYSITKYSISGTDYYGSTISKPNIAINSGLTYYVDTLNPEVTKFGITTQAGTYYDYLNTDFTFEYSEALANFVLETITYKVGYNSSQTVNFTCDGASSIQGNKHTLTCDSFYIIGSGTVVTKGFKATLTDAFNNTVTLESNDESLISDNQVTISSSISQITPLQKKYYYNGETIEIGVNISGTNNFLEYTKIALTMSDESEYVFVGAIEEDGLMTLVYNVGSGKYEISTIDFYKNVNGDSKLVASSTLNLFVNEYFNLDVANFSGDALDLTKKDIIIRHNELSFSLGDDASNIYLGDENEAVKYALNCTKLAANNFAKCNVNNYQDAADGVYRLVLLPGALKSSNGEGYLNNKNSEFIVVINKKAPIIENVILDANKSALYENEYHYSDGNDLISVELSDGYSEKLCIEYSIYKDDKIIDSADSCASTNSSLTAISLPNEEGTYTLLYRSYDGKNRSSYTEYERVFVYHNKFLFDNTKVKINNIDINNMVQDANINEISYFNYLKIEYQGANKRDLLKSFKYSFWINGYEMKGNYEGGLDDYYFYILKDDFKSAIDDVVLINVELVDKLNNKKNLSVKANIDLLSPSFDDIGVQTTNNGNDTYTITITNDNTDEIRLIYLKDALDNETLLDDNHFVTSDSTYSLIILDKASNRMEKVYTTTIPSIELFPIESKNTSTTAMYEINISPFVVGTHVVESVQYLQFNYHTEVTSTKIRDAKLNRCTTGRVDTCYINKTVNMSDDVIEQSFERNKTFAILVKVNGVFVNLKNTNNVPVLDVSAKDSKGPIGSYLENDSNPDVVSSSNASEYSFYFKATDSNLVNSYKYLIVKNNVTVTSSNFSSIYNSCYQYSASNVNSKCAIIGEKIYHSFDLSLGVGIGKLTLSDNSNTKKRFLDNQAYSLYVLLQDDSENSTVFNVYNFTNYNVASEVEYLSDSMTYASANDGDVLETTQLTNVRISRHNNVDIERVYLDSNLANCNAVTGCNLELSMGRHEIQVIDVLGNEKNIIIYSATSAYPGVNVYYKHDGLYYLITDNYAYNSTNKSNVYIKSLSNDLLRIVVNMQNQVTYSAGDALFDNIVGAGEYGITLAEVMTLHGESSYSGNIALKFINTQNGETNISFVVDNNPPVITLASASSMINLYGDSYELGYSSNKYRLRFNYNSIDYGELMSALSLSVDGRDFSIIKKNNRLLIKTNGTLVESYDEIIGLGIENITINYFDAAGNESNEIELVITVVDEVAPKISATNIYSDVVLNEEINLLENVIATDNYDNNPTITLKENGTLIANPTAHKFTSIGVYTISYCGKDSSNNEDCITKAINVLDVASPTLKESVTTEYSLGVNKELSFAIPLFVDNDATLGDIPANVAAIEVYDSSNRVLDKTKARYPLLVESGLVKLRFDSSYKLGTYRIRFEASDNAGNVGNAYFAITLVDNTAPVINVLLNGINVVSGDSKDYAWGTNLNVIAEAIDEYDGNITNRLKREVTFNGTKINNLNFRESGLYVLTYTVKDSANNDSTFSFSIRISDDDSAPVINEVKINDDVVSTTGINRGNYTVFKVSVDASDNSNNVEITINFNDQVLMSNGESVILSRIDSGSSYFVVVQVRDTSGNEVSKEYHFLIDNVLPEIGGISNLYSYNENVNVVVYDDHLTRARIYKDNILYGEYNSNINSLELTDDGIYRIEAIDSFDNVTEKVFIINKESKFNIMDSDNNASSLDYDLAMLLKVSYADGKLIFYTNKLELSNTDQVYLLVKYPNSSYKYIAYLMNGRTYLSNYTFNLDQAIIENVDNENLLEVIGGETYAYLMVVRNNNDPTSQSSNSSKSSTLKIVLTILGSILGVTLLLILFIKLKRRVRAV